MKKEEELYENLLIETADNYVIQARLYGINSPKEKILLIAGATGVPQRYYKRFAALMSTKGFKVVSFDYRGIADSKYASLKNFDTSVLDWAFKDLRGVIKWVNQNYGIPYVIGHSLGGHLFGLLSESNSTHGLITFGTGAGWHGWMPGLEKYRVSFLWNILGTVLVPLYGYLPSKMVGIGENLPFQVYKQWKHWCSYPHYWFDDPSCDFQKDFSAITVPVTSVNSTDDLWAPPVSAEAFMKHYDQTDLSYVIINAVDWNVKEIGHMGYFHSDCLDRTSQLIIDRIES